MSGVPLRVRDRRHAVREVRREPTIPVVQVHVHVGHPRDDVATAAVDARRTARNAHGASRADLHNLLSAYDDAGVTDDALGVERNDVDVIDDDGRRLSCATGLCVAGRGAEEQHGCRQREVAAILD